MSELERENQRLRAVVGELTTVVNRMRDFVIATVGLENFTLLENNAELEKENAELRPKAEAWEKLAGMRVDFWFEQVSGGWKWTTRANESTGATPLEAVMIAFCMDEDDHEMR